MSKVGWVRDVAWRAGVFASRVEKSASRAVIAVLLLLLVPGTAGAVSIGSFTPTSGNVGTSVTVNGSGFSTTPANNTVKFNGTVATVLTATAIKLTTTVPSGATSGQITVTVAGATATSSGTFTVKPQILSFTPASGGVGTAVTLHGEGFSTNPASNAVTFHGTAAEVIDATAQQITTRVPVGATSGTIKVVVGSFSSTSSASFIVTPSITDFDPTMGPPGTELTVYGYNFSSTPSSNTVKFNGTAATVNTASSTQLDVTLASNTPTGAGPITVTVGSNSGSSTDSFTVTPPPTIDWFSPTSGAAGTLVTIHGTSFNPDYLYDGAQFGNTWTNVVAATSTTITAVVPEGAVTAPIHVYVGGGSATSADPFTVSLGLTFSPLSAPVGATVAVTGSNFSTTPSQNILTFDNPYYHQVRANVTAASSSQLTFIVPPGAGGPIHLEVGSEAAVSTDSLDVLPDPLTVSERFTPDGGAIGSLVTVQGTGFSAVPANNEVSFNGAVATPLLASPTQLVVAVPSGATSGPITVSTGGNPATTVTSFYVFASTQLLQAMPHAPLTVPMGQFGYALAIDGDTAVIGAPGVPSSSGVASGVVYVFRRNNSTNWTLQSTLSPADAAPGELFGSAVAIQGSTLAVGAPANDDHAGVVYVFQTSGSTWSESAELTAADGSPADDFGQSLALDSGTLIVGAPRLSSPTDGAGKAYVFSLNGSLWTQEAQLLGADSATGDRFGHRVSVSGNTVLVGAPNAQGTAGRAYVFVRSGTLWGQQDELYDPAGAPGRFLGCDVSLDTDTALVGAPANLDEPGSAFLFERAGTSWTLRSQLQASESGPRAGDSFGVSVALQGDNLAVGGDSLYYAFHDSVADGWQIDYYSPDNASGLDQYGYRIALSGSTIVVGAPLATTLQGAGAGFAEIHTSVFPDAILPAEATVTCANGCDGYGNSVAMDGDTALVGDVFDRTNLDAGTGSVYVFTRGNNTWTQQTKLGPSNDSSGNAFGTSVAIDGDTAVVGTPDDGGSDAGAAYVFIRSGTLWSQQARVVPNDWSSLGIEAGTTVGLSGDTLILGAPSGWGIEGSTTSGAAYIFMRNGSDWNFQSKVFSSDTTPNVRFASSVAIRGDTAVFGAPQGGVSHHGAYVFVRNGTTWTELARLVPQPSNFSDDFGTSVALSNGSILVGSPNTQTTSASTPVGNVYVYHYDGSAWSQTAILTNGAPDVLGESVASAPDLSAMGSTSSSQSTVYPYACSGASQRPIGTPFTVPYQAGIPSLAASGTTILETGEVGKVFAFEVDPLTSSIAITDVTPSPAALGGSYTVSVTLSSSPLGCANLAGTVSVSDDVGNTCSIDPAFETSCSLPATHDGEHPLTATFVPANTSLVGGSSGTGSAIVTTPDSSATVSIVGVSAEPSIVGHAYDVSVSVTPEPPAATQGPTGSITVSDGVSSCSISLPQDSCTLPSLEAGDVALLASYSGDANYMAAVSTAYIHTIGEIQTLALTGFTPGTGAVGANVSLYGRGFDDTAPANNAITFNGVPAVTLSATATELTTTVPVGATSGRIGLTVGAHSVLSNDAFAVVSSPERTVQVIITSVTPEPSLVNEGFSVQIAVTPMQGSTPPTGTVIVTDGASTCQIVLPASACTLVEADAGQVALIAQYSGDAMFDAATSPPFIHLTNASSDTEICGFDPSAVPNDPPGFVPLNQASGAARTAGLAADIVGSGTLSVSIASPIDGTSTSDASIDVYGTFSGPVNTGITVNGRLAYTYRGQFFAPQIELASGSNTLTVAATTLAGASATTTASVTRSGNPSPLLIASDYPTGYAPSTVEFIYTLAPLPGDNGVQSVAIEYTEDGVYDYTSTDLNDLPSEITYAKPGLHTVTVRVVDTANTTYVAQRKALIQDLGEQRGMLCDIYAYLKDRFAAADAVGASYAFQPTTRAMYLAAFQQLGTNLPNATPYLGTIVGGEFGHGMADLEIARDNVDQTRSGFPLRITQGADGVWRISEM